MEHGKSIESNAMIKLFEHEDFGKIRVTMRNGEPWFYAIDVARALGYKDTDSAVRRHCLKAETLMISDPESIRGNTKALANVTPPKIIPESDVYGMVAKSHKPEAQAFMMWIFEKVLPAIRRTGKYEINVTETPGFYPMAPIRPGATFFQDALPEVEAAVKLCQVLGIRSEEVGHRAVEAIKAHYGVDLKSYIGDASLKLLGPLERPAAFVEAKKAAGLLTPTLLGKLAYKMGLTQVLLDAKDMNVALKNADLQTQESYTNGKGKTVSRWRLIGDGHSFGHELALDRDHSNGEGPVTSIKWDVDVLDVLKEHLV